MTKKSLAFIIGIPLAGIAVLVFLEGNLVRAQTKEQLCAQYAVDQSAYECCLTHTSQNFEECFTETPPDTDDTGEEPDVGVDVPDLGEDVPDVGPAVCAHRDAKGNRCDESVQRCAPGCPPLKRFSGGGAEATPAPKKPTPGPLTKKFAELAEVATPVTFERIVDFDGNELAPEDVLRGGIDATVPAATFEFPLKNLKKGQPVNALFSAGPPEALPLTEVIFTPAADIADGTLTVSIVEGSMPQLLGTGAPGSPDYHRIEENLAREIVRQSLDRYHLKYVISAEAKIGPASTGVYDAAPISEVLFKMVTSLLPAPTGFDNPETEVALVHLNKNNKWDPLPVEKGSECLFDNNLCTFTARSPSFSIFAIALEKKSTLGTVPAVLGVIFWIFVIIYLYKKFWEGTEEKRKSASKSKKIEIVRSVGFIRYVLVRGFLLGNAIAVLTTLMNVIRNKLTLTKFTDIYLTDLAVGLLAATVLWFISARRPKKQ